MKKHMRFAALLAGTLTFITACPTAYAADELYYFGVEGNETFQTMQMLDDKGTLQYGVLNAFLEDKDTPYYLCTCHIDKYVDQAVLDPETGIPVPDPDNPGFVKYHKVRLIADPMYLVVPRSDVIRFVFRNGLAPDAAVERATAIIQKYFPDTEPYYALNNFYEICVEDENARTAESSESLMRDLAEAGLISAFYTWGETARYLEVEHGYLTAYNPAEWEWAKREYDWGAIEEWVKAEHPECVFACVTDKESDLAKQLGIGWNAFMSQGDTFYAVIPPEDTSFPEHYALAMELYEQFALTPNAYPTPYETLNSPLTGQNALALAGDVTLDCSVDVSDAVLLSRFCAEDTAANITQTAKQNADANQDGDLSADDVIVILKMIAKLI